MKEILLTGCLTGLLCLSLLFCPLSFALASDDEPLAVIGNTQITVGAFKAEMERRGHGLPGSFAKAEQREDLLTEMVRSEEMYASALKEGYDKRPEVLEALKRLIISRYREFNLEPELAKLTVTEDEIKAYYKEHPADFSTPNMVRAAVIQITVPKLAPAGKKAELLKRAESARAEALKLDASMPTFGGVAVKYSDDQVSRYRGGDTGLMKKGEGTYRWDKEIMDTIFSMKKQGEISPVINTEGGYYLVKLVELKESAIRPLDEVRDMVRGHIFFDKKSRIERDYFNRLSSTLKVSINRDLLNSVGPPVVILQVPALPGGPGGVH